MVVGKGVRRPTISEIAERAGVSAGAVSYALNGRAGVSEETRARILAVAREVGWVPSTAARALRSGGTSTVGLVITREPAMLGIEPFFMAFVAGIEQVISDAGYTLMLQVTADPARVLQTYREWWSARRIDGLFITDLELDDPRLGLVSELGLPAVVVGDPAYAADLPAVGSDDAGAADQAMARLAALGHTRVAHIAGPERFVHTRIRSDAIAAAARRLGMTVVGEINTDYSLPSGAAACEELLALASAPTAIICDNDLTALGASRAAATRRQSIPSDLSILAWDDSPLCELTEPPLSALSRDIPAYGRAAAKVLLELVRGKEPQSDGSASVATLLDRGSIAAPRS